MELQQEKISDLDIRHYIYTTLAGTTRPPTTFECAEHFDIPVAHVEAAYERLANAHHIALAAGSHSIWMSHPFSGLPTNYVTEIGAERYWGN
jgi:hypothetical protein